VVDALPLIISLPSPNSAYEDNTTLSGTVLAKRPPPRSPAETPRKRSCQLDQAAIRISTAMQEPLDTDESEHIASRAPPPSLRVHDDTRNLHIDRIAAPLSRMPGTEAAEVVDARGAGHGPDSDLVVGHEPGPAGDNILIDDEPMQDYFQVSAAAVADDARSIHSETSPQMPANTVAAIAALQYLPVPVLVLSSLHTVVLANEAMGRLLGVHAASPADDVEKGVTGIVPVSDLLCGKTLQELGVTMLQNGLPIWVSWDVGWPRLFVFLFCSFLAFFILCAIVCCLGVFGWPYGLILLSYKMSYRSQFFQSGELCELVVGFYQTHLTLLAKVYIVESNSCSVNCL